MFFILLGSLSICTIWSCSTMRWDYGFNSRNRTYYTTEKTRFENGKVKMIKRVKGIFPIRVLDAAVYSKIRIIRFDENGKMKSDSTKERICSTWGNEHIMIRYKLNSDSGKVKKGTIRISYKPFSL